MSRIRAGRRRWVPAALLAILAFMPGAACRAHDARPVSVEIRALPGARHAVRLRIPDSVAPDNHPRLFLPEGCRRIDAPNAPDADLSRFVAHCPQGLEGRRFAIRYPLYNPSLSTLFRIVDGERPVVTQLLPPDQDQWTVPSRRSRIQLLGDYLRLGVAHIVGGYDHLLFVAGLLLIARDWRRILACVTGFTAAHSVTLGLSALGLVRLPSAPVEAAIALSILFLAREIVRPAPRSLTRRYPALVAALFGLLHGFGFAAALRETGLPDGEAATGLLGFNLGVEIGQLLFVALLLGLWRLLRPLAALRLAPGRRLVPQPRAIAGFALGVPAGFWLIERLNGAFGLIV